jgi:hypothetical protein
MWSVTTTGELPDEYEQREHAASAPAWNDYAGRILDLEINGFTRDAEVTAYGRRWVCNLFRGMERMTVAIERPGLGVSGSPAGPGRPWPGPRPGRYAALPLREKLGPRRDPIPLSCGSFTLDHMRRRRPVIGVCRGPPSFSTEEDGG